MAMRMRCGKEGWLGMFAAGWVLAVGGLVLSACTPQPKPGEHVNQGITLQQQGNIEGAIAEYRLALAADPNDALAHYNLGTALQAKKDYNGAIAEYRQALALKPDISVAHLSMGYALAALNDREGAIAELKAFVQQATPGEHDALKAKAEEDIGKLEAVR